jgi:hypothetical protein
VKTDYEAIAPVFDARAEGSRDNALPTESMRERWRPSTGRSSREPGFLVLRLLKPRAALTRGSDVVERAAQA